MTNTDSESNEDTGSENEQLYEPSKNPTTETTKRLLLKHKPKSITKPNLRHTTTTFSIPTNTKKDLYHKAE
jgi:hypothetical protein